MTQHYSNPKRANGGVRRTDERRKGRRQVSAPAKCTSCELPSGVYSAPFCCAECANNSHSRGYGSECTGHRTWHVQRERINGRGQLEYYDTYRTHDGWEVASAHFDATEPLPGERVYVGYSDREQATILHWKGELAIPPTQGGE